MPDSNLTEGGPLLPQNGEVAHPAGRRSRWAPVPANSPLIDSAIRFWQPRSPRPLSREDAREIVENITGFFSVLLEWEEQDRAQRQKEIDSPAIAEHCDQPRSVKENTSGL